MPHSRTDIELDNEVLKMLTGAQYKVLRYLVNRADPWGKCHPGNQAIADGTHYDLRYVEELVPELVRMGLVAYLRRNEFDKLTRQPLKNVLMVNPAYICLAEAYRAEAQTVWNGTGVSIRFRPNQGTDSTNTINQYQEPTPKGKPVPLTNTTKQRKAPLTKKGKGAPELDNDPTAARENDETQDADTVARSAQRSLPTPGVPPDVTFRNPEPIHETLPDGQHETLALRVRGLGISMPLARGFVAEYGAKNCEDAMLQTFAADRSNDQGVRNHAGFFRYILQTSLVDRYIFKANETDQEAGY